MSNEAFVQKMRDLLFSEHGFLDMQRIVAVGREDNGFTASEISAIEHRHDLPDWLIKALGLNSLPPPCSGASHQVISRGETYDLDPPQEMNGGSLPPIFSMKRGATPDVTVTSGKNGVFTLQNFLKIGMMDGGYIPEISDIRNLWAWEIFKHRPPTHLRGSTLICVTEGSTVFLHWLLDTMPRFRIAELAGFSINDFDNIVLATAQSAFHREGLEALKIDGARVRSRTDLGPVVACERFCVPSMPRRQSLANPFVFDFINNIFRPDPGKSPFRRIYLPRGTTTRRPLYNEAELLPLLEEFGFEVVIPDKLSVRAMAALSAEVSHVVAPHGAGLTNLAFMPAGARILELYGAHISADYWLIANQRRHHYICLRGLSESHRTFLPEVVQNMGFFERNALGYRIDLVEFRRALSALCV